MKKALLAFCLTLPAFAVLNIGEAVPGDMCWVDRYEQSICTGAIRGAVVVLIFNTGWCPGCNSEMSELSNRFSEMKGKSAIFLSLSSEGFSHGSPANRDFLEAWQKKHSIPFIVASSKDSGKAFFKPPYYIPSVAILDKEGKLAFREVDPSVSKIFSEVNRLLALQVN